MKIGRNEPCPCGSGKKYKKCCKNLKTLLGVDHSDPPSENIGRQEAMLADLLGGIVDHELGRADLRNMARDDELDTPEALELMKELARESAKLDEMLAAYGEEYDMPDPLDGEDEEEEDGYDGYEPEPYYDYLESQYEEAEENGLLLSLKVLPLDEEHSDKDLVEAVNYYKSNDGDVKENAPLRLFNKYEQRILNKDGDFRPALWAMLLSGKFTEALKDRTAFLIGANKYGYKGDL